MPEWAIKILETYGPGTVVSLAVALAGYFLAKALSLQMSAGANKDNTMTGFAVRFDEERRMWQERYDAERRQWEERHEKLKAEFTDFRVEQAKKEGGVEVLQQLLSQEREERHKERAGLDEKYGKLEGRVQELEKNNQQSLDRIRELESERDAKNVIIGQKDATIKLLEAENGELKNQVEVEANRANAGWSQLKRLEEAIAASASAPIVPAPTNVNITQPIPPVVEAEETYIPEQTEIKEG